MLTPTQFRNNSEKEASQKNISQHTLSYKKLKISPPTLIEIDTLNIAYIRHFGSYKKFDEAFQELHSMAKKESPHHPSPENLGIIHDNPQITEEANLRFDACIVVPNEIQPIGKIGYKKIKGGKFAVFRYSGTFETFYPVYNYLYNTCLLEYKWELRDEPIFEYYISSPPFCNSKNLTTDFYVPIL